MEEAMKFTRRQKIIIWAGYILFPLGMLLGLLQSQHDNIYFTFIAGTIMGLGWLGVVYRLSFDVRYKLQQRRSK